MRVTEVSKREQVLENIQKTSARLQDAQIQMATGQRINKPSDDPIGTAKMQDIVSTMSAQEQHLRNITDNIASLQHAEKEITHMTELLGRAKTLAISQSGSDANEESRMMVAREFAALRESLFDAGNSRNGKLYLFSGLKSLSPALKKNSMIQPAKVETRGIIQKDIRDLIDIDQYRAVFEGHSNNEYRLRITKGGPWGQARCQNSDDGGRTWAKEQILRPVTAMFNPDGKQDDLVKLKFSDEQGLLGNTIPGYFDFTKEVSEDVEAESLGLVFPDGMEFIGRPNPEISYIGAEDKKEVEKLGVHVGCVITYPDPFHQFAALRSHVHQATWLLGCIQPSSTKRAIASLPHPWRCRCVLLGRILRRILNGLCAPLCVCGSRTREL